MTADATAEPPQPKSPYSLDLAFIVVIIFAFALRLYYFFLTKEQPLWWDEAVYMLKAKALAFGTPETGWYKARPVLLPFIAAGLFKFGIGETAIRLLWVALSTAAFFLLYRIGALLINKRVGLYAVVLASAFYIDLFYAMRLLVDVPQVFFVVLAAFLLVRAVYSESAAHSAWAVAPVLVLGTAMRFTVGIFLLVAAIFLIVVRRGNLSRDKRWLVSLGLGVAASLPFLAYYEAAYGNPFFPFVSQGVLRGAARGGPGPGQILLQYILFFPNYTNLLVTLLFIAGVALSIIMIMRRTTTLRNDRIAQAYLLLLLWAIVPFLFFSLFVDHFEDRYLAMTFPAVFLLTAAALERLYGYIRRFSSAAAEGAIAVVLLYAVVSMALHSHAMIADKLASFAAVRDAGLWVRERSHPDDTVVTSSVPQNTYYSERASYAIPKQPEDFARLLAERKPKFLVLSLWEQSPAWSYRWPAANPIRAKEGMVFFLNAARTQPIAVVYILDNG